MTHKLELLEMCRSPLYASKWTYFTNGNKIWTTMRHRRYFHVERWEPLTTSVFLQQKIWTTTRRGLTVSVYYKIGYRRLSGTVEYLKKIIEKEHSPLRYSTIKEQKEFDALWNISTLVE